MRRVRVLIRQPWIATTALLVLITLWLSFPQIGFLPNNPKEMTSPATSRGKSVDIVVKLMKRVYGDWAQLKADAFPIPMAASEAGPSTEAYKSPAGKGDSCQRRYLWTDAFGVLNFVSLARVDPENRAEYLNAGRRLIEATRNTLGRPRSESFPMVPSQHFPGYGIGMRIGKVHAKSGSDAGMMFDGMYWHYIDKWLFCLLRFGIESKDESFIREAAIQAKDVFPYFFPSGRGLHWKLTSDLKPIKGLPLHPGPSDDALGALVVFSAINAAVKTLGSTSEDDTSEIDLTNETEQLQQALKDYNVRVSGDPLGYGLKWWELQWFSSGSETNKIKAQLGRIASIALDEQHLELPFRLYGAILGARLSGDDQLRSTASSLLHIATRQQERATLESEEHYSINTVMFCSALIPDAFRKLASEPNVGFP